MTQRDDIRAMLRDGRCSSRITLSRAGFSSTIVGRMLIDGELERVGNRGIRLPIWADRDPIGSLSAAFGGRGIICLFAAARVYDLTDVPSSLVPDSIAVPPGIYHGDRGTGARIIRWTDELRFSVGVINHLTPAGIQVSITDPARTVFDLFWSQSGAAEGGAIESLARLYQSSGDDALNLCHSYALKLVPSRARIVSSAIQAVRESAKWISPSF